MICERELIKYYGINGYNNRHIELFTNTKVEFTYLLPIDVPEIQKVSKVWVTPYIVQQKMIKYGKRRSIEGQNVEGLCLMISGDIYYLVEYVGKEDKRMYTNKTIMPFCSSIMIEEGRVKEDTMNIEIIVEDIYTEKLDSRGLYNTISMLLIVDYY